MTQPASSDSSSLTTPAGLLRRLGAAFYDAVLVGALLFVASALVTIPVGLVFGQEASAALAQNRLFRVWIALVPLLFFVGFWSHGGQTLGMKTWRLVLVSEEGGSVGWKQAAVRFFAAILSWLALGLGFLWALSDPERRTWHDRISHTRLINKPQ